MRDVLINICDNVIEKYRIIKEEFRYDGEYINHLASLIYAKGDKKINSKEVKKIRSFIKDNTSRMSSFRGDILYIISFLIGSEYLNYEKFAKEMIDTYEMMLEADFKESQYLVLTAYAITRYVNKEERFSKIQDTREVYNIIKERYNNVTNSEDYLACALLIIDNVTKKEVVEYMDKIFESIDDFDIFSKNNVQALTLSLLINNNNLPIAYIKELFEELEERELKVSHQFLSFMGATIGTESAKEYVNEVEEVINYLCEEEPQYEYYMDKSFRSFLAIALIEISKNSKEERYIKELLSFGIYSFIVSKNQGLFAEVLA